MENKTLKYWKAFAIVLIVLNIILIVFLLKPRREEFRRGGPHGGPAAFMIEKLKLSGPQEMAFKKLVEAHRDSIEILDAEGRNLRKKFFNGLKTDTMHQILAEKIAANQLEKDLLTYNHFEEVKELCTPEQKLIFNDLIQEIILRMGGPPPKEPGKREE